MTNPTPTSGAADLPEALHRVIDDFERRERGIPQAHIAAALVTELRAALAAGQTAVSAIDASPSAASIAWNALRDATDPLGELGARIMGHARIYAQRQYEAGCASHGQAPAQTADFTTLGAAMRAIQQAIGLIGDPADERMRAVRRVLRGAVVVAEDSGDIPAQPAPPADSVQEDAMRYRWLRDEAHPDGVVNDDIHVHVDSPHYPNRWALLGPELDAAVDAARAAQKEGDPT